MPFASFSLLQVIALVMLAWAGVAALCAIVIACDASRRQPRDRGFRWS